MSGPILDASNTVVNIMYIIVLVMFLQFSNNNSFNL